ncbi:MAG: ankyrin repeat domain-containing protein [Deltaproteobacteria bacterium]|nr:ankyrin repeat domain-containing protein [Deltaproteobacteria bacterium]
MERYAHGPVLRYSSVHLEDHYGGLGDQPLDRDELGPFEIAKEEFEAAWSVPIVSKDEPRDYNEVFRAISSADVDALRAVIAAGHDVNAPDPRPYIGDMNTPLHHAASLGSAALVRVLLESGARVDARCVNGWTPLLRACSAGALEVAKLLMEAGADIEARSSEGYTAYGRVPGDAPQLLAFMKSKGAR